jgi:Ser/Thr protein kinase RdoA (MazF antagonist)
VTASDESVRLEGGGRNTVLRRGNVVIREARPWTPAVHTLLRHLEQAGFAAAPRLAGSGLDAEGRETLTFIDGEFTQPGPWSLDGAAALGAMLRDLHHATCSFRAAAGAVWFPWHGRDLGSAVKVIGHCDVAPWNIVARGGLPVALIDWETAGPVDPLVEPIAVDCDVMTDGDAELKIVILTAAPDTEDETRLRLAVLSGVPDPARA